MKGKMVRPYCPVNGDPAIRSRFNFANDLQDSVAIAFRTRMRLVEDTEGFFDHEVFTDSSDRSVFYLSMRLTSAFTFRKWHSNEAHHTSHEDIPKDFKLDPAFTQTSVMDFPCD
jgi:heme-degrading monooxygenase HmoA